MAQVFNIKEIVADNEKYSKTIAEVRDLLEKDFKIRKQRVTVICDESYDMSYANLFTNLMLMFPFVTFNKELSDEYLLFRTKEEKFNADVLSDFFNKVISNFRDVNYHDLNKSISIVIESLSDYSGKANVKIGNTISLQNLIQLSEENKELDELLHFTIGDKMQFNEIEDLLKEKTKRLVEILSSNKNVLQNYLLSKTGINVKQMAQCILNVGLKPDLMGNVIADPINTNYLRGLRNVQDLYINAVGARKALITNFKKVKESGYLTRKLSLLTIDTILDYDTEDCGTKHYTLATIRDKATLERLRGRLYLAQDEEGNEVLAEIEETDDFLIGYDIMLRSPITCAGERICRHCYGDNLAKINKDLHVGIIGILFLTNILTQLLLSSKHLLQTKSAKIDWTDDFNDFFTVDRNLIFLSDEFQNSTSSLVVERDDIKEDEENPDIKVVNRIYVNKKSGKTQIDLPISLNVSEVLDDLMHETGLNDEQTEYSIPLKYINPEMPIFTMVMENNELSAGLKNITDLIETNHHLKTMTIHELYNKFIELLNEAGITIGSVHIELILRNLLRDYDHETKRPDFTKEEFPEYKLFRVSDAIIKSENLAVSLAYEKIKMQLESPETYEKEGVSLIDVIF